MSNAIGWALGMSSVTVIICVAVGAPTPTMALWATVVGLVSGGIALHNNTRNRR